MTSYGLIVFLKGFLEDQESKQVDKTTERISWVMNSTKKVKLFSRIKNDGQGNTSIEKPSAIENRLSRKLRVFYWLYRATIRYIFIFLYRT